MCKKVVSRLRTCKRGGESRLVSRENELERGMKGL